MRLHMGRGAESCQILFYYGFPVPGTPRPAQFMPRKHHRYSDSCKTAQNGFVPTVAGAVPGLASPPKGGAAPDSRSCFPVTFATWRFIAPVP